MDWFLIADMLGAAALFAGTLWIFSRARGSATRRQRAATPADEDVPDTMLAHAEATVNWAEGSRADWDRHVRPILAREFNDIVGSSRSPAIAPSVTGDLLFGSELWPLVDPAGGFTSRRDRPGPGRGALADILHRLESA